MFKMMMDNNAQAERIVITLQGEIDISSAPEFKAELYEMVGDGQKDIALYCSDLSYIDSTGLGILVGALKRVKSHQKNVYIYQLRENIRKLFHITGLDRVFILEEPV
ncbi:MAG: STAS domain-containing protein [Clostridiaceae bacterium]|jgi:anti-sigma B factor antagonist|nr:STAS domain-containing protein [Clostridiaceae bacterium]